MIRTAWKKVLRFLGSPRLALALIVFVGLWSMLATVIPQVTVDEAGVAEWAERYESIEPVVRALRLHRAFSAPIFVAAVVLLGLSTIVCSLNRTKLAIGRTRQLKAAANLDCAAIAATPDLEIECAAALGENEVLDRVSEALSDLGIETKRRDGVLSAVSPAWSVWGSPVFHWSLVMLVLAVFAGILMRSEGSMAIPLGDVKPDQEASYLSVRTGPLHDWARIRRAIRVADFDPSVIKNGIELGAVPTVSVLDAEGDVVVTQQVYPNKKLHAGSLSLYAPACGLAATLAIVDPSGNELTRVKQLVDFSQEASGGTVPVKPLAATDRDGNVVMRLSAMIPLDPDPGRGGYGEWIPSRPAVQVSLLDGNGATRFEGLITTDQPGPIAGGGEIRLVDIGWFSHLNLVDDPSIPLIYASMIAATLGLALSVATRQQLLAATVVERDGRRLLAVKMRLWRNVPTIPSEVREELICVIGADVSEADDKGSAS